MCQYFHVGGMKFLAYDIINASAFFVLLLFNFFMLRKNKPLRPLFLQKKVEAGASEKLIFFTHLFIVSAVQFFCGTLCNGFLAKITVGAGANYFGMLLFSPILVHLLLRLLQVNPLKHMDRIAPGYALVLVIFKLACFCHGCCEGRPSEHGLYFPANAQAELPSQLYECAVALGIFLVMLYMQRKNFPKAPGSRYPTYVLLYCTTRFCTEFTRANKSVLWKLQPYHLWCLLGLTLSILGLFLAKKFGQRASHWLNRTLDGPLIPPKKGKAKGKKQEKGPPQPATSKPHSPKQAAPNKNTSRKKQKKHRKKK